MLLSECNYHFNDTRWHSSRLFSRPLSIPTLPISSTSPVIHFFLSLNTMVQVKVVLFLSCHETSLHQLSDKASERCRQRRSSPWLDRLVSRCLLYQFFHSLGASLHHAAPAPRGWAPKSESPTLINAQLAQFFLLFFFLMSRLFAIYFMLFIVAAPVMQRSSVQSPCKLWRCTILLRQSLTSMLMWANGTPTAT